MAGGIVKGERAPLSPGLYDLVQKLVNFGMTRRYLPPRMAALAWEEIEERCILEVGCGTGAIPSRGVATDLDLSRVRYVAGHGRLGVVADGQRLPFAAASFSVVYCEGVVHHIDDGRAVALVAEMLRVCRPEGRVVVIDSVWPKSPFRVLP